MPELNGVALPVVAVPDVKELLAMVQRDKLAPEQAIELAIYLKREAEKLDVFGPVMEECRKKIVAYYAALPAENRGTVTTRAARASYTKAAKTRVIKDRDETVAALTEEQLRISYIPDVKALETILRKEDFQRLTQEVDGKKAGVSITDLKGEFEEF